MTTSPFDQDRPPQPERRGGRRRRSGRRGDPNATVPDAEFTSYYGRHIVQAPPWTEDIPAYLFLGGLAAGSGLMGAGAAFTGRPSLRRRARVSALVALGAGGFALAHDLGRPERFLNMMRTVKLTSPMSVGSWILMAFGAGAGGALACEVGQAVLPSDSTLHQVAKVADPVAAAASAFFAPPLAAYTAVLLSDTAIPTWHQSYRHLPAVFVSSATAAGAGLALVLAPVEEAGPVRQLAALGAACDLVAAHALDEELGELGEPWHEGKAGRLRRASEILTVVGGVGALLGGRNRVIAAASGLALLAGSACTRFAIFEAGMESAKDPKYIVKPQRERAEAKARAGEGITQPGGAWPV